MAPGYRDYGDGGRGAKGGNGRLMIRILEYL
jgi:hypothetical protein